MLQHGLSSLSTMKDRSKAVSPLHIYIVVVGPITGLAIGTWPKKLRYVDMLIPNLNLNAQCARALFLFVNLPNWIRDHNYPSILSDRSRLPEASIFFHRWYKIKDALESHIHICGHLEENNFLNRKDVGWHLAKTKFTRMSSVTRDQRPTRHYSLRKQESNPMDFYAYH